MSPLLARCYTFSDGAAYFGEWALYWPAAKLLSDGTAYFGEWALYWPSATLFSDGSAYFGRMGSILASYYSFYYQLPSPQK